MNTILKAELTLLAVAFFWGTNPPIMKLGLVWLPPILYNTLRMGVAFVCALLALGLSKQYRPMEKGDAWEMLKLSVFGFLIFQLFFTLGVQHTTAGNASLMLGMLPVWVAIIHKICNIEGITRSMFLGIVLSFVGIVVIVIGSGKEMSLSGDHMSGALLLTAAQIGYAYYTVFSKGLVGRYSHYQVTTFVVAVNTVIFTIISLPEIMQTDLNAVPVEGWLSVLYSGIFAICVGNFLWIWGVSKLGSAKASLYNNLAPAFAILGGYVLLGETFGLLQAIGTAITFGGLYLTRTKRIVLLDKDKLP